MFTRREVSDLIEPRLRARASVWVELLVHLERWDPRSVVERRRDDTYERRRTRL